MKRFDLVSAIKDPKVLKPYFPKGLETWKNWITFFKVLSGGYKLSDEEMALFRECTGLHELPEKGSIKEVFLVIGRRGAKSTAAAILAVFYALWGNWENYLSPGEVARIFIIACNKDQGQIIMRYIKAIFDLPMFKDKLKRPLTESIELKNGVHIEIKPASWRSTRGFSVGLFIMEELAYWRFEVESQTRDKEIYTALKPSTSTIKNSLIIGISTPFARQGLLYEKDERHFGKPGPVLLWKAPTWVMNETLTKEQLEDEYLETMGENEFNAEFAVRYREDIEQYLPLEVIDRAIVKGRQSIPSQSGVNYVAFCDPSEGLRKGGDSMTFAVAHTEEDQEERYIIDVLLEFVPPFEPKSVISDIAAVCEDYDIDRIVQDRHAIAWIASDFEEYGIIVETADKVKSDIYELFAVEMNRGVVELPDYDRLRNQLMGLQRFVRSGGAKIDHLRGGHDDCVNSCAGAMILAKERGGVGSLADRIEWI